MRILLLLSFTTLTISHAKWCINDVTTDHRKLMDDCPEYRQAYREAYNYLAQNIMLFDQFQRETLGFAASDDLPDGLAYGLIGPTIQLSLQTKANYSFSKDIPESIWREYVLNYANTNEARANWRPLLYEALAPYVNTTSIPETVKAINTHMYKRLAPRNKDSLVFVSSQTPLIFDTFSVLQFGYASCTGFAILFVNALRSVGVPARVVGTPAWWGNVSQGNHNWVEVWHNHQWHFLEPSPNQTVVDNIDRDPCGRWFCHKDRDYGKTRVFAAKLEWDLSRPTYYPIAWEPTNTMVPGEDVTDYYANVCGTCP